MADEVRNDTLDTLESTTQLLAPGRCRSMLITGNAKGPETHYTPARELAPMLLHRVSHRPTGVES
jgi:hypothetical protein